MPAFFEKDLIWKGEKEKQEKEETSPDPQENERPMKDDQIESEESQVTTMTILQYLLRIKSKLGLPYDNCIYVCLSSKVFKINIKN